MVDVVCVTYIELCVLRSCNGITVAVSVQIMRFELALYYTIAVVFSAMERAVSALAVMLYNEWCVLSS